MVEEKDGLVCNQCGTKIDKKQMETTDRKLL